MFKYQFLARYLICYTGILEIIKVLIEINLKKIPIECPENKG